jgi:hypothetical protein
MQIAFPLVLLFLGCVSSDMATQAQVSAEGETIRSLDDQERTALLNRDIAGLERLWSDQLTVNAPTNQVVVGKSAVLALVKRGLIHYSCSNERPNSSASMAMSQSSWALRPSSQSVTRQWPGRQYSVGSHIFGRRKVQRGA